MTVGQIVSITVSAHRAATAWLNAFLAASQDEGRPVLCRTLSVEIFENGVQFIGCDGTMLLRTWVPSATAEGDEALWPDVSEEPIERVVVLDAAKFAVTFIKALLAATKDEDVTELTMALEPVMTEQPALGDDLGEWQLTLSSFGQHMRCTLLDQKYVDWRRLQFGLPPAERVEGMTIAPRLFATVGKLRDVSKVDCEFSGANRQILVRATGLTEVRGLLMPMRRDQDEG